MMLGEDSTAGRYWEEARSEGRCLYGSALGSWRRRSRDRVEPGEGRRRQAARRVGHAGQVC